jgi:hypothetical protein
VKWKSAIPIVFGFIALFLVAGSACAGEAQMDVSFCELANNPRPYDGRTIRVRGTLSVHFEDFSLYGENCRTDQPIWLAFGGDVPGIVASTINDGYRKPGADLMVNGTPFQIKKDENFRRLYALISTFHGDNPAFSVTATLTGAFFAGEERQGADGKTRYGGYGHLGCCALFVITEVDSVESVPPADLNLHGTVVGPDGKPLKGFAVFDDVIGGFPAERQQTTTDEHGMFQFSNSGSLLRIENPSYRPIALPVKPGGAPIRVKLEDAKRSDWLVPQCREVKDAGRRIGFSVLFMLPTTLESKTMDDGDLHYYLVFPLGGSSVEAELQISTSEEELEEQSFGGSKRSRERWIKDGAGKIVGIDASGVSKRGGLWRSANFGHHDLAVYRLNRLPKSQASAFDTIIDSACLPTQ